MFERLKQLLLRSMGKNMSLHDCSAMTADAASQMMVEAGASMALCAIGAVSAQGGVLCIMSAGDFDENDSSPARIAFASALAIAAKRLHELAASLDNAEDNASRLN